MAKRRSSTSGWCRPSPEIERRSPPTGAHVDLCRPQGLHDVGPAKSPWRFSTRSGRSCLGFMQGSVVLWVWLVSDVVRDDMEPARASGIMWFSTPHRCDGHPCLPSYHPRSGHGRRAPVPQPRPLRPLATLGISLGVGIPLRLPGGDAQAGPDSATSKPTSLAEPRAGGMLKSKEAERVPRRRCPVVRP